MTTVKIGSKEYNVHSSAYTAILYRMTVGRDLFKDMKPLLMGDDFPDTDVIMSLAYVMAKEAGEDLPDSIDEWVKDFGPLDFFNAQAEIINVWVANTQTTSTSKKKNTAPKEK